MKKSEIRFDEWRAALIEARIEHADTIPTGWISVADFAQLSELSESYAYKSLRRLAARGKAEMKKFRVATNGRLNVVSYYRLKK